MNFSKGREKREVRNKEKSVILEEKTKLSRSKKKTKFTGNNKVFFVKQINEKSKKLYHNKFPMYNHVYSKVKDPRNIKILDFSGRQGLIQKKRHKKHNPVQLGFLAKKI